MCRVWEARRGRSRRALTSIRRTDWLNAIHHIVWVSTILHSYITGFMVGTEQFHELVMCQGVKDDNVGHLLLLLLHRNKFLLLHMTAAAASTALFATNHLVEPCTEGLLQANFLLCQRG